MTSILSKIAIIQHFIVNMGWRYIGFRGLYEIRKRTGLLKAQFPVNPPQKSFVSLAKWQQKAKPFFFESKHSLNFPKSETSARLLQQQVEQIRAGKILFFDAEWLPVTDWLTNPSTQFRYDVSKHWTEIPDLSTEAGDIKYVWEKSRFAFLYTLIRYDYHANEDMAAEVFEQIDSWIAANPVNQGPNWRCSQEITLRVLNWTFALNYYKHSPALTEERFANILNSIYWQMRHVETNINFSRISVRNNHALTETLGLYLVGILFPFFPESSRWKTKGKAWFEEEAAYQIYEDGTFLQFSMNYHRVAVQLLTWAIVLAEKNNEKWANVVYDRAEKSCVFLRICQDPVTGWLPNYGNNDGALFFRLNDAHFRDYRPQLAVLTSPPSPLSFLERGSLDEYNPPLLTGEGLGERFEDLLWYNHNLSDKEPDTFTHSLTHSFKKSGYYVHREDNTLTFLRCGGYKDRPFQADGLHLDIWHEGQNFLCDAGSYKYNTDEKWLKYFGGTASHNTVMLGDHDQMLKGGRFIWYNWTKAINADWTETAESAIFEGEIEVFTHLKKGITHRRKVTKFKNEPRWLVEDWLLNAPADLPMIQIWHTPPDLANKISFEAFDETKKSIEEQFTEGSNSELYGQKTPVQRLIFSTSKRYIATAIKINF